MVTDTHIHPRRLPARAIAIATALVVYGAVDAQQPAVRASLPLPVSAQSIASALRLPHADPATLLLTITRVLYEQPTGQNAAADRKRIALREVLWTPGEPTTDKVPLPLDPAIWRESVLETQTPDHQLVAAIMNDRRAALLLYGLSALDDETLGWVGGDRPTLQHLRDRAGVFAAFGRSLHVRGSRVAVPGGDAAEPLWADIVGVEPAKASAFVQKLFRDDGRLAFLYDTIAHLDPARQRFALGLYLPEGWRTARLRALLDTFSKSALDWRAGDRPFMRPALDGAVVLSTVIVSATGAPVGPTDRSLWEAVLRDDDKIDVPYSTIELKAGNAEDAGVDASWLVSRIARMPYSVARRRLDTYLFGQRVFSSAASGDADALANALRATTSFPALALTLERLAFQEADIYVAAARHAATLSGIPADPLGRHATMLFQGALAILDAAHRRGGLSTAEAQSLTRSLCAIEPSGEPQYVQNLARWIGSSLVPALPVVDPGASDPKEIAVLAALAGRTSTPAQTMVLEWEGQRYRVDPATAEFRRLRRVRERQAGTSLDSALAGDASTDRAPEALRTLAEIVASMAYAPYLGDPDNQAVTSGNVAVRHDFTFGAWRLPSEDFTGQGGWHVRGSLLGLEAALGRLSLRRLDPTSMPGEPRIGSNDLQTLMMTAALFNPREMTDAARDEIAAAVARGRARAAALTGDPQELDRAARDAGLSEWERVVLGWTAEQEPKRIAERFGPLQLFWLGSPRPSLVPALRPWGVSAQPLSGCLCLDMPAPRPGDDLAGRPTAGIFATRYADVSVQVAAALKGLDVPAAVAAGVMQFALQEAIDHTEPAHGADGAAFARAAAGVTRNQIIDFIAALTAGGVLIPESSGQDLEPR